MGFDFMNDAHHCIECQAGQMRREYITYYTWLAEELITVPGFPAWVCDVCGRREYDNQALNQLSLILSPNAGKPSPRSRSLRSPLDPLTGLTRRPGRG